MSMPKCPTCHIEALTTTASFCHECGTEMPEPYPDSLVFVEDTKRITIGSNEQGILIGFERQRDNGCNLHFDTIAMQLTMEQTKQLYERCLEVLACTTPKTAERTPA